MPEGEVVCEKPQAIRERRFAQACIADEFLLAILGIKNDALLTNPLPHDVQPVHDRCRYNPILGIFTLVIASMEFAQVPQGQPPPEITLIYTRKDADEKAFGTEPQDKPLPKTASRRNAKVS